MVLGFLIAFSYQITKEESANSTLTDAEWNRVLELRNNLSQLEERNLELQNQIAQNQATIIDIEKGLANEEEKLVDLAEEAKKLRMFLGKVKVKGPAVVVTLDDGEYNPLGGDINNFLVHEHHVFKVVNELYISGAEAVAINGHRLTENSYIICNGPVITVDGNQYPAPFVISAIGNVEVLEKALNLQGGIKDQLVNDNIVFKLEKKSMLEMEPVLSKR